MEAPAIELIGGESPWEIVRAYPYITVTWDADGLGFEVSCRADGTCTSFIDALGSLTAAEARRGVDRQSPSRDEEHDTARALVRLVRLVEEATGAVPPAWPMFYNEAHGRGRHPSAQAERVGRRRPRRSR